MTRPRCAIVCSLLCLALLGAAMPQRDADEPTSDLNFLIVKEDNDKPVRNAAVIMHPVSSKGKQGRGGIELKTDAQGKASIDGIPYGKLRVQVLASGFQTFGDDYDVNRPKTDFTIKLKRPQGQYSIYDDHGNPNTPPKQEPSPNQNNDQKNDKPN
jgi:hypothetical protein